VSLSLSHWAIVGVSVAGIAAAVTLQLRIADLRTQVAEAKTAEANCLQRAAEDNAAVMEEWVARQRDVLAGVAAERARLDASVDRAVTRLRAVESDWRSYVDYHPLDPACRADPGRLQRINAGRAPVSAPVP
jgi:hypothetical protein